MNESIGGVPLLQNPVLTQMGYNTGNATQTLETLSQMSRGAYVGRSK